MRANWITALLSGVILGGTVRASGLFLGRFDVRLVLPVFFFVAVFGVTGFAQIRELHAARKKRELGFDQLRPDDFPRFYFPAWGRMFLWFVSTVATEVSLKTILA